MTDASTFGVSLPDSRSAPAPDRAAEFGVSLPSAPPTPTPEAGGAFFGAAGLLPQGVQDRLPSFLTGPSVGEQLTSERQQVQSAEAKAGHPLGLKERLAAEPVMQSPVAMGFSTHQVGALPDAMAGSAASAASKSADRAFTKAVKPLSKGSGKADATYVEKAKSAISAIIDNKANLKFSDPTGQVTAGELPKSLHQFSEAIEQTKSELYKKYDTMAQQAGAQGARVDVAPIADDLDNLAGASWLKALDPSVANYAETAAANLRKLSSLSASDAQQAIQHFNAKLSAFFGRGAPGGDDAGIANVQATIARSLRKELSQAIEHFQGPGYQDFKNQHGALQEIEKRVAQRASQVARQEPGGILGKFVNAGSIAEILHGIALGNPAALIRGIGLKGGQLLVEHLRNPDRAVQQLFQTVEQQRNPAPPRQPIVPAFPLAPILPQQNQGASAMGLQ